MVHVHSSRLIDEKNTRLQELKGIEQFCLISQQTLNRSDWRHACSSRKRNHFSQERWNRRRSNGNPTELRRLRDQSEWSAQWHPRLEESHTPSECPGTLLSCLGRFLFLIVISLRMPSPWASWRFAKNSRWLRALFNCQHWKRIRTSTKRSTVQRNSSIVSVHQYPNRWRVLLHRSRVSRARAGCPTGTNERRESLVNVEHGMENSFIHRHWLIPNEINWSVNHRTEFSLPRYSLLCHLDVCDTFNNRLVSYTTEGVFQQVYRARNELDERQFHFPYAVHIDSKNRLYLIDQSERRIKVFNRDLKLIRLVGQYGQEVGQYAAPCDLCTNEQHQIFVCDAGSHRILKYTEQGQFLMAWGGLGTDPGQFKCPACVCLLNDDRLVVSDWGNDRLQIFNSEGDHLLSIGQRGKLPMEFSRPLGLAYDQATERLFVCDEGNNRVTIFSENFTNTAFVPSKVGFRGPYGLVLLPNGRLMISEHRAHRLQLL